MPTRGGEPRHGGDARLDTLEAFEDALDDYPEVRRADHYGVAVRDLNVQVDARVQLAGPDQGVTVVCTLGVPCNVTTSGFDLMASNAIVPTGFFEVQPLANLNETNCGLAFAGRESICSPRAWNGFEVRAPRWV